MAKWYGMIGYAITKEPEGDDDVWREKTVEMPHYGEMLSAARHYEQGVSVNDDLKLNARLSIVADDFAMAHLGFIRYAVIGNVKWKVTAVEPQRPRLILTLGTVWND